MTINYQKEINQAAQEHAEEIEARRKWNEENDGAKCGGKQKDCHGLDDNNDWDD